MRTDTNDQSAPKPSTEGKTHTATLSALRMAAVRLADTRKKPKLKTRDLVGLLLSHGARAWRSSMPVVITRLSVKTPDGVTAVRFGYSKKNAAPFLS
jgi:hypothetical protein